MTKYSHGTSVNQKKKNNCKKITIVFSDLTTRGAYTTCIIIIRYIYAYYDDDDAACTVKSFDITDIVAGNARDATLQQQ